MDVRTGVAMVLALVCTGMLNSCNGHTVSQLSNKPSSVIFEGFSYIGCFSGGIDEELPSHGLKGLPLPDQIKPGFRYVFHFPRSEGDEVSPLEILPKRLRRMGFDAPDPTNIISLSSGGPIYEIKFSRNGCSGRIRHEVDKKLLNSRLPWNRKWEPDDTILSVSAGCDL
jgi:hypothetical protein